MIAGRCASASSFAAPSTPSATLNGSTFDTGSATGQFTRTAGSPYSLTSVTTFTVSAGGQGNFDWYFDGQVPTVRCRFFNSYGPGEVPGLYRNVIPNFVWRALRGEPLVITGTGEETRDFIYVDDLVTVLLDAAAAPGACGEAFNLGTGVQTRVADLAEIVIKACRSTSQIEFAPRRSWDRSLHREADISKATAVLGFRPTVGIR